VTLAKPLSRHSDSAASRMASLERSLRLEASGAVFVADTSPTVLRDETIRLDRQPSAL
jgi:hypothetical protein